MAPGTEPDTWLPLKTREISPFLFAGSHDLVVQAVILRLNEAFSEVIICFYFEPFLNVILVFMVNSCTFVRLHLVILLNRDFDMKSDYQDCGMAIFL